MNRGGRIVELAVIISFIIGSVVNYKFGYKKGYLKGKEDILNSYEMLNEQEVDKITDWHREHVYHVGSYPENWDVIRKLNKAIGRQ